MTKSIKKALTSVLLFGLMALTLAGCGKKKETVTLYG